MALSSLIHYDKVAMAWTEHLPFQVTVERHPDKWNTLSIYYRGHRITVITDAIKLRWIAQPTPIRILVYYVDLVDENQVVDIDLTPYLEADWWVSL